MKLPPFQVPITIDVLGDLTKTRWIGNFVIKRVLTHRDKFDIEKWYKRYLEDDSVAGNKAKINASALAELRVRVVTGPPWWEGTDFLLDCIDETPIAELLAECAKAYKNWEKEVADQAKEPPKNDVVA